MVILAILLLTDTFRGNTTLSRWRDPEWLAWLAVPFYWLHQFEEYSLPVIGIDYSIQEMICEKIGFPPYPECPIPLAFYPVVNIALMWFGAPLAAYLFRRNVVSTPPTDLISKPAEELRGKQPHHEAVRDRSRPRVRSSGRR